MSLSGPRREGEGTLAARVVWPLHESDLDKKKGKSIPPWGRVGRRLTHPEREEAFDPEDSIRGQAISPVEKKKTCPG